MFLWAVGIIIGLVILSMITHRLVPAIFLKENKMPTDTLMGRHDDWPHPFKLIPRRWSALISKKYPVRLFGKNKKPVVYIVNVGGIDTIVLVRNKQGAVIMQDDIPRPGGWVICWPIYFAFTMKNGWSGRIGIRKDYFDPIDGGYWTLSTGGHKININPEMEQIYDDFYNKYCR